MHVKKGSPDLRCRPSSRRRHRPGGSSPPASPWCSASCPLFWTVLHSMKTRLYQQGGGRVRRRMRIYVIKRLTSFPPSYEESQASAVDTATGLAPRLYSRDASEAADCMRSWEQRFSEHSQTTSE